MEQDDLDIRELVFSVPAPSDEQIRVGVQAIDDFYSGAKDPSLEDSVAYVYRAMRALERR